MNSSWKEILAGVGIASLVAVSHVWAEAAVVVEPGDIDLVKVGGDVYACRGAVAGKLGALDDQLSFKSYGLDDSGDASSSAKKKKKRKETPAQKKQNKAQVACENPAAVRVNLTSLGGDLTEGIFHQVMLQSELASFFGSILSGAASESVSSDVMDALASEIEGNLGDCATVSVEGNKVSIDEMVGCDIDGHTVYGALILRVKDSNSMMIAFDQLQTPIVQPFDGKVKVDLDEESSSLDFGVTGDSDPRSIDGKISVESYETAQEIGLSMNGAGRAVVSGLSFKYYATDLRAESGNVCSPVNGSVIIKVMGINVEIAFDSGGTATIAYGPRPAVPLELSECVE